MPKHDIIDNRKEKLVDHINRILSSTSANDSPSPPTERSGVGGEGRGPNSLGIVY